MAELTSKTSPQILLRPMQVSDLPQVYAIEQHGHQFPWTQGIIQDCINVGYQCWVIEQEANIMAYAIMSIHLDECHILNICVKPDAQRQGYGMRLMQHILQIAKQHGATIAFLEVRRSNTAAIMLYDKLGFNEIGVRENYYPAKSGREDAIMLALDLDPIIPLSLEE